VTVPVREDVVVFAAMLKDTAPLPFVLGPPPAVTVIHVALLVADQEQAVGIVTDTTRVAAEAVIESLVEESVAVQGAAAWVTVKSLPAAAIVPVREAPAGFGSTRYVTVPLPEPDAPVRTVIHDTLDTADHEQPPGRAISTLSLAPAATMFCVAGVSVASQGAPAWVSTNDWPATVSVAERDALVVFAATLYPTVPFPVPDVEVENVIQLAGLDAVHAQPEPAVTAMFPVPAAAVIEALVGEML
jgi:hypothetical protein